jgi:hypothetical protein
MTDDTLEAWDVEGHPGFRARFTSDYDTSFNDFDCYGKVSEYFVYWRGHEPRPDGFDGSARKIEVDRSGYVWWQPPKDGPKVDTEEFKELALLVGRILMYGYQTLWVEKLDDEGNVVDSNNLGGVDPVEPDSEYIRGMVEEQIEELLNRNDHDHSKPGEYVLTLSWHGSAESSEDATSQFWEWVEECSWPEVDTRKVSNRTDIESH